MGKGIHVKLESGTKKTMLSKVMVSNHAFASNTMNTSPRFASTVDGNSVVFTNRFEWLPAMPYWNSYPLCSESIASAWQSAAESSSRLQANSSNCSQAEESVHKH